MGLNPKSVFGPLHSIQRSGPWSTTRRKRLEEGEGFSLSYSPQPLTSCWEISSVIFDLHDLPRLDGDLKPQRPPSSPALMSTSPLIALPLVLHSGKPDKPSQSTIHSSKPCFTEQACPLHYPSSAISRFTSAPHSTIETLYDLTDIGDSTVRNI